PPGPDGAPGTVSAYSVSGSASLDAAGDLVAEARCDPGDAVLGGGFETDSLIRSSVAFGEPTLEGWRAVALPDAATRLTVDVICSDAAPRHRTTTPSHDRGSGPAVGRSRSPGAWPWPRRRSSCSSWPSEGPRKGR